MKHGIFMRFLQINYFQSTHYAEGYLYKGIKKKNKVLSEKFLTVELLETNDYGVRNFI